MLANDIFLNFKESNGMPKEYLLDTNAFFNLLKESREMEKGVSAFSAQVNQLISGSIFISTITKLEIVSVLGKHARGKTGGFQKCTRSISAAGQLCQNKWYVTPEAKWNRRKINMWLQLIKEITAGTSRLISVSVLPFDEETIHCAEQIIPDALVHNFASMDAMIAATAQEAINNGHNMTVVTSDKGLKACLSKTSIPCWDAFKTE